MEPPEQEHDRQRRLNALRKLAQQGGTLPHQQATHTSPQAPAGTAVRVARRPARTRAQRLRLILGALLALVVIVGGIAAYVGTHRPTTPGIPTTLTIDLAAANLACPTQMEWSPDGTRVAVSAFTSNCVNGGAPENARVVIFDARTGRLLRELNPQTALTQAGIQYAPGDYTWTPDGSTLVFQVGYGATELPGLKAGLLLMPVDGGVPRFIQGPETTANGLITYVIWDVRAGTARLQTTGLPAARAYSWTADGQLVPNTPFPAEGAMAPPTGSPVQRPGAPTFSYWQPGTILPIQKTSPEDGVIDPTSPPLAVAYWSETSHWSPDGRYLATPLSFVGRVTSTPDQPALPLDDTTCQYSVLRDQCDAQPLPLPDAAFKTLVDLATRPSASATQTYDIPVAWRPDGKLLAAMLPGHAFDLASPTFTVTLYDTRTGTAVAALTAKRTSPNRSYDSAGAPDLYWSPSGKQLAVFDFGSSRVTIWSGAALPA